MAVRDSAYRPVKPPTTTTWGAARGTQWLIKYEFNHQLLGQWRAPHHRAWPGQRLPQTLGGTGTGWCGPGGGCVGFRKASRAGGRGATGPGSTGPTCLMSGGSAYGSCARVCVGGVGGQVGGCG